MEKLFYGDVTLKEFHADITEMKEIDSNFHVLLNRTAFFPGGGGQFCDIGNIENNEVIDVYEQDEKIYHVLENKPAKMHKLKCTIEWDRRWEGMCDHLGQHILSGCFFKLYNANTVSFHLGSSSSTVDIEGVLDAEKIREVEKFANDIIAQNIMVESFVLERKNLKNIKLRRDFVRDDSEIRIVKIGNLDTTACCGIHPRNTLGLKVVRIKKYEKYKSNTRIEFLTGERAVNYLISRDECLNEISKHLSSNGDDVIKRIQNTSEKLQQSINKAKEYESKIAEYEAKDMILQAEKLGKISVVKKIYENSESEYVSKVGAKISEYDDSIALLASVNGNNVNLIFACSKLKNIHMGSLLKDAITLMDGKGGGSANFAQGGGRDNGNVQSTLDYAIMKLKQLCALKD